MKLITMEFSFFRLLITDECQVAENGMKPLGMSVGLLCISRYNLLEKGIDQQMIRKKD